MAGSWTPGPRAVKGNKMGSLTIVAEVKYSIFLPIILSERVGVE